MHRESQAGLDMSTQQGHRVDRQGRDSQSHRFAPMMNLRSFARTLCLAQGLGAAHTGSSGRLSSPRS